MASYCGMPTPSEAPVTSATTPITTVPAEAPVVDEEGEVPLPALVVLGLLALELDPHAVRVTAPRIMTAATTARYRCGADRSNLRSGWRLFGLNIYIPPNRLRAHGLSSPVSAALSFCFPARYSSTRSASVRSLDGLTASTSPA